jgi:putative two-component system response regulator
MAEALDKRSGDHADRLLHMCNVFAEKLFLPETDKVTLQYASILHDIGKLAVPAEILTKEKPLDDEEWRMMQRHTVTGASFCEHIENCGPVKDIIRHHHENYDGTGYPDGLKGDEIPYLARVFQIVDIYDSMSNNRIYNDAFPRDRVIAILAKEAQRGLRDSSLMKIFLDIANNDAESLVRKTMSAQPMSTYKINAIIDSTMKARNKTRVKSDEDERR